MEDERIYPVVSNIRMELKDFSGTIYIREDF